MNAAFAAGGPLAEPLLTLTRAVLANARPAIILAVADDELVRMEAMAELGDRLSGRFSLLEFDFREPGAPSLPRFCRTHANDGPVCVLAHGLEALKTSNDEAYQSALGLLNAHREDIRVAGCVVVLSLSVTGSQDLRRLAPDFSDWRTASVSLVLPAGQVIEQSPLGRITLTEAENLRSQVRRFQEMLQRENLEPALAAEFQRQRALALNQLGHTADAEEAQAISVRTAGSLADHQIINLLCQLPTFRDQEGRDLLVRALPEELVADIGRSNERAADLDEIISRCREWGWVEDRNQWALEVVLDNARQTVAGTEFEGELPALGDLLAYGSAQIAQEYRRYLISELKDHMIRGFAPQVGGRVLSLPLAEIFLPLQAIEGRPALVEYSSQDLQRQHDDDEVVEGDLDWRQRAFQIAQPSLGLADLLVERRAVLLGDPGSGKTTLTRYVAHALAAEDYRHIGEAVKGLLPVLIRLAGYAEALEKEKSCSLVDYVESDLTPRREYGRLLRQAIRKGTCLIILDGLDEVSGAKRRYEVTDRIHTMLAAYGGNRFLATSRIVGYNRTPLTREFTHVTLQGLGEEDRHSFVKLWSGAIGKELGDSTVANGEAALHEAMRTRPAIARLAANPLLLTIMVLMHWRGTKLPSRRVQVYQNATDTLIEYWTTQRVELDAEEVKAILAPIAHHILSGSVSGVIARRDLLPRLHAGIIEQRGCQPAEAERLGRDLLAVLSEQSGLFLERGADSDQQPVYGFLHYTLCEYLAALHLAGEVLGGSFKVADYMPSIVWHEPLLLLAGHLSLVSPKHVNELLRATLDHICPNQENELLASECLTDDIPVKPALRDEILKRLGNLLQSRQRQIARAADALFHRLRLAQTRHRDAASSVLLLLRDNSPTNAVATAAAERENRGPVAAELEELRKVLRPGARERPPGLDNPGSLLRAEYQVIPFQGRLAELERLAAWCKSEASFSVWLLSGGGGSGKTRLLIEWCQRLARQGWHTGFLVRDPDSLGPILSGVTPRLCVIDYAETRLPEVRALVRRMTRISPKARAKLRVVLLARSAADWWEELSVGRLLAESPLPMMVPTLAASEARGELFALASTAFARALGCDPPAGPLPDLAGPVFDRVLYLHLAALAAVQGQQVTSADQLLTTILEHEQRFWYREIASLALFQAEVESAEEAIGDIAAALTLTGGTSTRERAEGLAAAVSQDLRPEVLRRIVTFLHRLYPGDQRRWVVGVEPDFLGEHVVRSASSQLIDAVVANGEPDELRGALTHLTRLAARSPEHRHLLAAALVTHLDRLAGPAAEVAIETGDPIGQLLAEAIEERKDPKLAVRVEQQLAFARQIPRIVDAFRARTAQESQVPDYDVASIQQALLALGEE